MHGARVKTSGNKYLDGEIDPLEETGSGEPQDEADLWFLPGPSEDEPDHFLPGPMGAPQESDTVDAWRAAEAAHAAKLARVAARLGMLDERLRRGPAGWRNRLALIEAAELSWFTQQRIGLERLSLYVALRVSSVNDDAQALFRLAWAVRRLEGGPGLDFNDREGVSSLEAFLDRRDRTGHGEQFEGAVVPSRIHDMEAREAFTERADAWLSMMRQARDMHPISLACMGFHLWHVAEITPMDDLLEAAVTAVRVAVSDLSEAGGHSGAMFAPIAMGGGGGFRTTGDPSARLSRWLDAMESAVFAALRRLDRVEVWATHAAEVMAPLSGRTPPKLREVFAEWPLASVELGMRMTGAHRATVQRNIDWMEEHGLVQEMTRQGRYRMWRILERKP